MADYEAKLSRRGVCVCLSFCLDFDQSLTCLFFTEEDSPSSPKQHREDDEEEATVQDYEAWKKNILENALKTKKTES